MSYSIAKGTFDIIPEEIGEEDKWRESHRWQYLEEVLRSVSQDYGFKEIRTPILEKTDLFVRSVGESSDIVTKEMYTFMDRGERSMTLRPEGTAPVIRSLVEKKYYAHKGPQKFFYLGQMFRYERPQAGRYRQFHQYGAEAIGIGTPEQDVELIDLSCEIYRRLGLTNLEVQINSVGDSASRAAYKKALSDYLSPFLSTLSPDSQARFSKNILRILDSKDPQDQMILREAPALRNYLSSEASFHFQQVLELLNSLGITYSVNEKLVRGLDYYTKTVFEITCKDLGSQNALGGGGRYDGLIQTIGGPSLPSVGFAIGLERVLQVMMKQKLFFPIPSHPVVFFLPLGKEALRLCFELTCLLRHEKIPAEIDLSGKKVQQGLQLAVQERAEYAIVIGDEELQTKILILKNLATRETKKCSLSELVATLKQARNHV